MDHHNTIALYEAVAELTNQMLLAAKQQDWDKLAELELSCAQYVEKLKSVEDAVPLPSEARERKVASIKSILADDREIRNLVSPWMVKLNSMINSNQTEKKLTQAYRQ
ncbi:MAG TPA: flagellar protein FliT [Methylophilaceae bacterium]|nr:flagellar protein FliT [Methylophilaceae bacterium]